MRESDAWASSTCHKVYCIAHVAIQWAWPADCDIMPPIPETLLFEDIRDTIARGGKGPLHLRVADLLAQRIERGELIAGQPLPPQRRLCRLLGIGEVTLRRALKSLADRRLIVTHQGSGTTIAPTPPLRLGEAAGLRGSLRGSPPTTSPGTPGTPGTQPLRLGVVSMGSTDGYPFIRQFLQALEHAPRLRTAERLQNTSGALPPRVQLRTLYLPAGRLSDAEMRRQVQLDALDGLIMMSPVSIPLVACCQREGVPYVLLFNDVADGISPCVVIDYGRAMLDAVAHHHALGRSRFALITSQPDRFSTGQLTDAFRLALQAHGLPFDPQRVIAAGYHQPQGRASTLALLDRDGPPQVIFYASTHQAEGGLEAVRAAGPRADHEVLLVAVGGHGTTAPPGGTSGGGSIENIELPIHDLARVTLTSLLQPGPCRRVVTCRYHPNLAGLHKNA